MTDHGTRVAEAYEAARRLRRSVGAPWFEKPWDLNLIVARSRTVGLWDDLIVAACLDDAQRPVVHLGIATGDAWGGEWISPSHPDGCIYVLDQHVAGGLELGEHRGRPALRQRTSMRYVRWPHGMGRAPTVAELEARAEQYGFEGYRGTHLHNRVSDQTPAKPAPNDSEGCTVSLYHHEHTALIGMVKTQLARLGSSIVSPTYCRRSALGL